MSNTGAKGRRLVLHFNVNKTVIMKEGLNNLPSVAMTVFILNMLKSL